MSSGLRTSEPLLDFEDLLVAASNAIGEDLDRAGRHQQPAEDEILHEYDARSMRALRSFGTFGASAPPGTLLLNRFYEPADDNPRGRAEAIAGLIAALLAATCEANARIWLNASDGLRIARSLESTAAGLLKAGLPLFAAQAYTEAANVYRKFDDRNSEDRCAFKRAGARRLALRPWSLQRIGSSLVAVFVGYGYRPMRLLIWIIVVMAGFAIYLETLPRNQASASDAFYVAIQNFVNPMGLVDVKMVSADWKPPLEIETYVGDIMRNVFFVLLIRRWFRL